MPSGWSKAAIYLDRFWNELSANPKATKNAAQARRLLAIAAVLDGSSRDQAAKVGGMDRQTLRDWVIRFNAQGRTVSSTNHRRAHPAS